MRLVISGYYGFHNVGDEAILYSIIQALRQQQPDIDIVVLSNDPTFTKKAYGVEAVNRWSLKEIIRALRESDGLISGGGSLLQDKTGWRSIPYYTGVMQLAKRLGKPVMVYAQGIGPVEQIQNKWLVKNTMNKVDLITVRDEESKQLLESLNVDKTIKVVPDPVMGLSVTSLQSEWWSSQSFQKPVVAVSVREWPCEHDFKRKIALALDRCVEEGYEVVFVPMHGKHDEETSKQVAAMMEKKAWIAPYDASIEEKIAIIAQATVLVGMRLHSLIFASITNTPFIALSYDPKIDAFAKQAQQLVFAHVEDEKWDGLALFDEVRKRVEQHEQYQAQLMDAVRPLKETARETAAEAIALFKK
ncbi:polysaccharide pyruvyl transferase CsaB [Thermolongibacillus altinsuensis]|uniref:Polysaccharide pyruvyl transferase CsaB n=1 Tax=Thermolongibacillus altinsuensis TaxID=575256 RepID=A0A4R1QPY7_9BACL|nr:polysaccharide pyruvyl transferase CsaB [Thermolongibacillus altinsuensis]TCL52804.1 polysaccharide pyruvyl transferase CsaB [Thermolongibacillus altinsuensis]